MLKRGQAATAREFLLAAEHVLARGNPDVVLCERGVRGFDRVTRNVLDVGTVARIKAGDIDVVPGIEAFTPSGVRLTNGGTCEVDAVVLATGYRSGLEELVDAPELRDRSRRPAPSNIHFVGYRNSLTGLLHQIGVEAEVVAGAIA